MSQQVEVDHLDEDTNVPENQKYVCLSFLGDPENKLTLKGIKIKGAFSDYDQACKFARSEQNKNSNFNVYIGEVGKWLPFDPDPESKSAGDAEYANKELNSLMKKYKDNQEKVAMAHRERKEFMLHKNNVENLKKKRENINFVNKAIEEADDDKKKEALKIQLKELEKDIKSLEEETKNIENLENNILNDIDEDGEDDEDDENEDEKSKDIDV